MELPSFSNVLAGAKLLPISLMAPKTLAYMAALLPCGHGNISWHQLEGWNPISDTAGDISANRHSWEGISYS